MREYLLSLLNVVCEKASKGAVASFLIATPQTGIDSILATFSLMGLGFAVVRPVAALIQVAVPDSFFLHFGKRPLLQMLVIRLNKATKSPDTDS